MSDVRQYHIDEMHPTIPELIFIESELRLKLDHILNGAELSEYAGEVDLIMDEIQILSDNGINLMSDIMETAENALHSLCISMGVISTACDGGRVDCGSIVAAACYAAVGNALIQINAVVDEAIDKLEQIESTAITPEIDESTANEPNGTNTEDTIGSNTEYPDIEDANYNSQEMDSGDSGQLNTGERLSTAESLNFTAYKSLPIFNPFFWISIFDSIIIYYQIIMILKRMKQLHGGIEEEHDSRKDIQESSRYKLFAIETTDFLNQILMFIAKILLIALPLIFIFYAVYLLFNTTIEFFEIDSVTKLGLYQLYTAPVIAIQYKTNTMLYKQQQIYNQKLLPSLTNAMLIHINTIKDTMDNFNSVQYENVSLYNQQKCELQWSISSYSDEYWCFKKYYDITQTTEPCQGCGQDIKAMCMVGNNYVTKQFYGDKYEIFNAKMAEKRKYCQFDEYPNSIYWHINDDIDANSTEIYANWDKSLTLKCGDGMIVNSIHYIGSGDYKINENETNDWYGVYEAYSYLYQLNVMSYNNAHQQCLNIDSDLISIHSVSSENEIIDILQADNNADNNAFWIGLNDISNERHFVWTDSSSVDYTNYIDAEMNNERKCRYTGYYYTPWGKKKYYCLGHYANGDETDGILWTKNGWYDVSIGTNLPFLCKNPNVNVCGIENLSSFMHSINSIKCVQANRGPFLGCTDFIFSQYLFGDNNGPLSFSCENAADLSGYDNTAWFLNGFIFADDSGLLSSLKGIRCCYIPGTIFNIDNEYLNPSYPAHLDIYGETIISGNDSYQQIGIKSIVRGSAQSIQGFMFDSISDYIPRGCSTGNNIDCITSRIDIVDYESFTSSKLDNNITANINIEKLICDEGCHPNITIECDNEYKQDINNNNGNPNAFVQSFQCDNINFTVAVMDKYEQCEIYPVYPALFYDYNSKLHEEMVSDQLSPYVDSFGICIIKLWHTFFIWIILKVLIFPLYFMISTFFADKCCQAVRKKHVAKIELVLKLNENALEEKKYDQNKTHFLQMIRLNKNDKNKNLQKQRTQSLEYYDNECDIDIQKLGTIEDVEKALDDDDDEEDNQNQQNNDDAKYEYEYNDDDDDDQNDDEEKDGHLDFCRPTVSTNL